MKKDERFIKSAAAGDPIFQDGHPQVAIIGRSNVGKSSLINALFGAKDLVRVSATPGRTRLLNVFAMGKSYLVDLPGYGYAKMSKAEKQGLFDLVNWYLFISGIDQKHVIVAVDAKVGLTADDRDMLYALEEHGKDVIVAANKIDKLRPSQVKAALGKIKEEVAPFPLIPCSAEKKIGIAELKKEAGI